MQNPDIDSPHGAAGNGADLVTTPEALFLLLMEQEVDVTRPGSYWWAHLVSGPTRRSALNAALLVLSRGAARMSTVTDARALLLAADAVRPLHGAALSELAYHLADAAMGRAGLVKEGSADTLPLPGEAGRWASVLARALCERAVRQRGIALHDESVDRLLSALERCASSATSRTTTDRRRSLASREQARLGVLVGIVRAHGYALPALLASFVKHQSTPAEGANAAEDPVSSDRG